MKLSLVSDKTLTERKTRAKLTLKEFADERYKIFLIAKGFNINNPVKVNSRYIYFEVNKDLLNGR